ncbi:MAG: hypothetical protein WAU91_00630 [Desulfatitalea sp.]
MGGICKVVNTNLATNKFSATRKDPAGGGFETTSNNAFEVAVRAKS